MPIGVYKRAIRDPAERLFDLVSPEPNSGCWLFTGCLNANGYGDFCFDATRHSLAHRASYELFVGRIPDGLHVLHKCDVTSCVNPDHLTVGTHTDNMRDCENKGRRLRGERHPSSKVNFATAAEIRNSKERGRVIARRLGISEATVSGIRTGRLWQESAQQR